MPEDEGKKVQLIEELRVQGRLILMSENSLFGIWHPVCKDIISRNF